MNPATRKPKLLLLSPTFFNYYKHIAKALEARGFEVHFVPDRPPVGTLMKILIRKMRGLVESQLEDFHRKEIERIGEFDRTILIRGECVTPKTIATIRQHSKGPIVLYHWDSVANTPGAERLLPLVDKILTFDPEDARRRGWDLLPICYVELNPPTQKERTETLPLCFLGSIHSDRPSVIAKVKAQVGKMFVFLYFPSRLIYWFRKFFDPSLWSLSGKEISFTPMEREEVDRVFRQAQAILDVHHPKQSGLTPRTIEGLVLGKKLITTNATIKEYPFYDPKRILVIDRKRPEVAQDFLSDFTEVEIHPELKKLEVNTWVERFLN